MTTPRRKDRKSEVVVVVGRKGSGKTTLIERRYVGRYARVITIDQTGESRELYPHAVEAFGLPATYDAIRELHGASPRAWHCVSILDPDEARQLFARLAPPYASRVPSVSVALGGVAVECGEIDIIAPASGAPSEFTNAVARGRHYQLSLILATQRPHQCSRMISSQADEVVSFRMHEPRDVAWLAAAGGQAFGRLVRTLPPYWCAVYDSRTGAITVLDDKRAVHIRHRGMGLAEPGASTLPFPSGEGGSSDA